MAFDSVSVLNLSKPTIVYIVNGWNSNITLSKPVISAGMNSYVVNATLSLPTVSFSLNTSYGFSLNSTLPNPIISSTVGSSFEGSVVVSLGKPVLSILIDVPNQFSFTKSLKIPTIDIVAGTIGAYSLVTDLKIPVIRFGAVLTGDTSKSTWLFNTITTAHSRFTNFDFVSFFKIGTKNYGIHSNGGIYELTGDRDFVGELTEVNIDAQVVLPASTYGEQENKMCSDAFVYGRGTGEMEVVVKLNEQEERTGHTISFDGTTGMHRKRVKIPKGLLGNVWQFTLKNVDGCNFDINAFEVFIRAVKRII